MIWGSLLVGGFFFSVNSMHRLQFWDNMRSLSVLVQEHSSVTSAKGMC